jgi:amidohydrolase
MPSARHNSRAATETETAGDLRAAIAQHADDLIARRRHFHQHPELSHEERETAAAIAVHLRGLGLDVTEDVGGHGVVGLLRGTAEGAAEGPTLMVRADIDALPITEQSGAPHTSQRPGVMHACGHDGHIAIAMTLAEILNARRDRLRGTVKFVFQPAEERAAGAEPMIAAGVMQGVDAVIGLHLWSQVPVGEVAVRPGAFFASADELHLRVRGRGGHGAEPHLTVDPVVATAQIITALQTLVSREINPLHSAVVTFGTIHGGTAGNVVADEVELMGTLRTYDPADREYLLRRIGEVVCGVAESLRAEAIFEPGMSCPACVNDEAVAALVRRAAVATVGEGHILGERRFSVSDDMARFLQEAPGCYFVVGSGNVARGITAPHHNARFDLDEACLPIGVEVLARAALEYLA